MTKTIRNAQGSRICPTCGEAVGVNLGQQKRHNAERHDRAIAADRAALESYKRTHPGSPPIDYRA